MSHITSQFTLWRILCVMLQPDELHREHGAASCSESESALYIEDSRSSIYGSVYVCRCIRAQSSPALDIHRRAYIYTHTHSCRMMRTMRTSDMRSVLPCCVMQLCELHRRVPSVHSLHCSQVPMCTYGSTRYLCVVLANPYVPSRRLLSSTTRFISCKSTSLYIEGIDSPGN